MKNKWLGQENEGAQGCPADDFRLLALDRLVPLLEVLLSEVPLLLQVPLEEVPLWEVPLWELLAELPEVSLLEVLLLEVPLLVEALLVALGAGL